MLEHNILKSKQNIFFLRSILENILLKTMFELPSLDNVEEVIVDSGAAKGASQPMIVHSKNSPSKSKTSKTSAA